MHGLDPNFTYQVIIYIYIFLKGVDGDANEITVFQNNCGNKMAHGSTCEEKTRS
jgi:hypothetical protein